MSNQVHACMHIFSWHHLIRKHQEVFSLTTFTVNGINDIFDTNDFLRLGIAAAQLDISLHHVLLKYPQALFSHTSSTISK